MPRNRHFPVAVAGSFAALLAFANTGLPPRSNAAEYQAHQDTGDATIAASIVSSDHVAKTFSGDINKKYVVVEIAVYPQTGRTVDLHTLDFALLPGADDKSYPATPEEVASIWRERKPAMPDRGVNVTAEAGVGYGRTTNPNTGRAEQGWGTYTGASVDNRPRPYPAPASPGPDPYALEAKINRLLLPEGLAAAPVAGYLFFPALKKKKGQALHLEYYQDHHSVSLAFPAK